MVEDKMADPFFSKQEDEKRMVSKLFKGNNLWYALPCKLSYYFSKCVTPLFLVIFILLNLSKNFAYCELPNYQSVLKFHHQFFNTTSLTSVTKMISKNILFDKILTASPLIRDN